MNLDTNPSHTFTEGSDAYLWNEPEPTFWEKVFRMLKKLLTALAIICFLWTVAWGERILRLFFHS